MTANAGYPGSTVIEVPTSSKVMVIEELARSLGIVLTSWQLDALDRALDAKDSSK